MSWDLDSDKYETKIYHLLIIHTHSDCRDQGMWCQLQTRWDRHVRHHSISHSLCLRPHRSHHHLHYPPSPQVSGGTKCLKQSLYCTLPFLTLFKPKPHHFRQIFHILSGPPSSLMDQALAVCLATSSTGIFLFLDQKIIDHCCIFHCRHLLPCRRPLQRLVGGAWPGFFIIIIKVF